MKPTKRFDDSDFESLLAHVADEYSEKLASGEQPDVEDYARQHPKIAEAIRRVLPALHALDDSSSGSKEVDDFVPHETLGDFRIIREIGRGGMGIVYEAEEESLGRSVALKVLPFTAMLDDKQLARFKNEARAAATLNHRNIVPVYSFGSERGVHYYSMKYIRGQSMAELIRDLKSTAGDVRAFECDSAQTLSRHGVFDAAELRARRDTARNDEGSTVDGRALPEARVSKLDSSPRVYSDTDSTPSKTLGSDAGARPPTVLFQNVAKFGIQAALALDHAHQQGVLHRDIKPANIMIDVNMHLWITDFGLARLGDDAGITLTGDLLGTARYMSPEQILAKRVVIDHRADIYSLGITLYELATLKAAFDGQDRYELWRQISFENPTNPRKIDGQIPVELETIILKAIEKNPNDRYVTAGELADDLQRFLDNKPIKAKPASIIGTASKWAQRHHKFVWATMAVMATIIAVLGVSTFVIIGAYQVAQKERNRAETNLRLAREVIDVTYNNEVNDLRHAPGMTKEQRDLLERLTKFYADLPEEELKEDLLFHDSVKARLRLGDIHSILGQYKKSLAVFEEAIAAAEQLCQRNPDREYQATLALAYSGLGQVQLAVLKRDESIESLRKANDRIDALMRKHPDDLVILRLAAEKIHLPIAMNETEIREKTFRETISQLAELSERFNGEFAFADAMAKAQDYLGILLRSVGRIAEAESVFGKAIETQRQLSKKYPTDPSFTFQQASILSHLAVLLRDKGDQTVAREKTQQAIDLLNHLSGQYPNRVQYQTSLAQLHNDLGVLYSDQKQLDEAAKQFEKSINILEPLAELDPDTPGYRYSLATNLNNLGSVAHRQKSHDRGNELQARAMKLWTELSRSYPDDAQYKRSVAFGLANSAANLDLDGRIKAFQKATEILEDLTQQYPERIEYTVMLIRYKNSLGNNLIAAERMAEAEVQYRAVMSLSEGFSQKYPEFAAEDDKAIQSATTAEQFWRMGKVDETVQARQIAISRYRLLLEQNPADANYRSELSSQLKRIAFAFAGQGKLAEALEHCNESIELSKQLHVEFPDIVKYGQKLVRRYDLLAAIHLRLRDFPAAERALRQKLTAAEDLMRKFPDSDMSTKTLVDIHVHLANVIDEGAANRLDDAITEMENALTACNQSAAAYTSLLVHLHYGILLNMHREFDLARPQLAEAAKLAKRIEMHLSERDVKERMAITHALWQIGSELILAGENEYGSSVLHNLMEDGHAEPAMQRIQTLGIANWTDAPSSMLETALRIAKSTLEESPEDPAVWSSLGLIQIRLARCQDAVASLEKSTTLAGPTIRNQLLLAIAHSRLENRIVAQQFFDRAKDLVIFGDAFQLLEMRRLRNEASDAIQAINQI